MVKVGDKVKVIRASHGWASVEKGMIGIVREIKTGGTIYIDFPVHRSWAAAPRDIELVQEATPAKFKKNERAIVTNGAGSNFSDNTLVTILDIEFHRLGYRYTVSGKTYDGRFVQQYIHERNLSKNFKNNQQALKLLRKDS